jgi:acyl-coenzyme A thioesterase PaaI-like protein
MDESSDLFEAIRSHRETAPEPSPTWLAKRKLASELRLLANRLCESTASEQELLALAQLIAERGSLLSRGRGEDAAGDEASGVVPGMENFSDRGPIAGRSNPISPPASLEVNLDAQRVVGRVEFGKAYEGAPGCVHGGFVAAVLDEALGMACVFAGAAAMTAELTTRFLEHTPIETPLEVEAWLDSVDGKKVRTSGRVTAGGVTVVDSSGLFISVGSEKFAALLNAQRDAAD